MWAETIADQSGDTGKEVNMSGGSFDWLFCKSAEDLPNKLDTLEMMAESLDDEGFLGAAEETRALIKSINDYIEHADAACERLGPVWKAMEWYQDGDTGIEKLEEAIVKYTATETPS